MSTRKQNKSMFYFIRQTDTWSLFPPRKACEKEVHVNRKQKQRTGKRNKTCYWLEELTDQLVQRRLLPCLL
jgi:hypothetical protein